NNFNSQKEDNAKADTKTEDTIVKASQESVSQAEVTEKKEPKKSIFDKWGEKFRDFLDNAE
ncbi:MAG: cell division protein FtsA, partial [Flavobacteriales bacterium CG_4_8_14_3_um_filter_35_10]